MECLETSFQDLQHKYERLKSIVAQAGKAAVAFSGGVDSSLLLKVSHDLLGPSVLAITASSESFPQRELEAARQMAKNIGCRHLVIQTHELQLPGFKDNPPERCYLCKKELFGQMKRIASAEGIQVIFDGSNAQDVGDYRPGRKAAKEAGVRSPLEEAGLKKPEVRALARLLGLPNWDRPSFACLASRFPYGAKITQAGLHQVEEAEAFLWKLGMRVFRVRHHGAVARIELGDQEMQRIWKESLAPGIVRALKSLGYTYVALDLEGYRSGSMNETLGNDERISMDPL